MDDREVGRRLRMNRSRGLLIVLEGIDGTGKTTLSTALARALEARGYSVQQSAEPTDGPHGQEIRRRAARGDRPGLQEELELFIADRRDHVERLIKPALASGCVVVLDRYYYSTMAYQGARGADAANIERRQLAFAPPPEMLVILDLPVEAALERVMRSRGSIPDEYERADVLKRVRQLYLGFDHPNRLVIDARRPTEEQVERILEVFDRIAASRSLT